MAIITIVLLVDSIFCTLKSMQINGFIKFNVTIVVVRNKDIVQQKPDNLLARQHSMQIPAVMIIVIMFWSTF